ncbi:hypothetical protein [Streptomyces sp. 135]|uniref:hypothetical protein n=1 Tax=Streptomyces sp. 135 TaxID=2838850 RepID=UPI001CC1176C|nr:hypothetical protein [Streptomyces sp. 135]
MALTFPLLAMGCSADPPERDDSPKGWAVCNDLFGSENIDSLVAAMGKGTARIENRLVTVGELADALVAGARHWKPGSDAHLGSSFAPCEIAVPENGARFTSEVRWSPSSLAEIASGEDSITWRQAGNGMFSSEDGGTGLLKLTLSCAVPGAHGGQESGIPLEITVHLTKAPEADSSLRGTMVSSFAKKLTQELPCGNRPNIPDEVPRR